MTDIGQIIFKPITTPEYSDPTEERRVIHDEHKLYGDDCVFVEDAIWNALRHIATLERCTVSQLCARIDLGAGGPPFAPAARYYVICYAAERLPADNELPPQLRFLGALRGWRSLQ
jgi:predicted DNA-binding ribbon-helix-helix protein